MTLSIDFLLDLILLFFTFSVLGWCTEVALKYRQYHRFINRGFLIGPYLPIYGAGVTFVTFVMELLGGRDDSYGTAFLVSFFLCGALEYFASWFMEKRFHARWWDYSKKPMNLHGRVWIGNLILFGIAGTVISKLVDPVFFRLAGNVGYPLKPILCAVIAAVMLTDYVVSHFVMKLVKTGVESSEADNTEQIGREIRLMMADKSVLHRRVMEAYPEVVFYTDRVTERLKAVREQTETLRREVAEGLEPVSFIKNDIIESQDSLIAMLESGSADPERADALRQEIARKKQQLQARDNPIKRVSDAVYSRQNKA